MRPVGPRSIQSAQNRAVDEVGRAESAPDQNGLLTGGAEPPPVGFSFTTDENGADLSDESGAELLSETL